MRFFRLLLLLSIFSFPGFLMLDCDAQPGGARYLAANALHPYGRALYDADGAIELIGTAAHVGFCFEGQDCSVQVRTGPSSDTSYHNYLQYVLDGVYQGRVRIVSGGIRNIPIHAAAKGRKHTVWLYKTTEAQTGPVFLTSVTGKGLTALYWPEAPMIEFIGNSITCGALSDPSETPCTMGVYHDQHNAYFAYGPRVARALKVNFMVSSVSGIGMYRNWNSDGPTMPQVYEKADLGAGTDRVWDFDLYNPRIVSIALGTNDFSKGDGVKPRLPFDSTAFVDHYIAFVRLVKSKYPDARIALLSSPMLSGDRGQQLENCLTAVKKVVDAAFARDRPVALYFFKPMQARGCRGHPSVEDHAILADELVPFFKKLL